MITILYGVMQRSGLSNKNLHKNKVMKPIVTLKTNRDYYDAKECAENSISVGEFMDMLSNYPSDAKIVFSNDNGYTYGVVGNIAIKVN
jgi:hypothetical protein